MSNWPRGLLVWIAWPAMAHVVSMSSGDLTIEGSRGHYELRMPLYEIAHVASPEKTLLEHIRFAGGRLGQNECHSDEARATCVCTAEYEFAGPVDRLEVECTFAAIT